MNINEERKKGAYRIKQVGNMNTKSSRISLANSNCTAGCIDDLKFSAHIRIVAKCIPHNHRQELLFVRTILKKNIY